MKEAKRISTVFIWFSVSKCGQLQRNICYYGLAMAALDSYFQAITLTLIILSQITIVIKFGFTVSLELLWGIVKNVLRD